MVPFPYSSADIFYSIRTCLSELYAPGITPDEKRELDESLQREVHPSLLLSLIKYMHMELWYLSTELKQERHKMKLFRS